MPPPQQQQRPQLEKTRSTRSISLIGEWCPEEEGLDASTRSSSSGRRYSVEIPSPSSHLQQQTPHRRVSLPHPNNNRRPVLSSPSSVRSDHLRRPLSNNAQNNNNNSRQKQEEPIFYSINTMLHRQEDDCWDNNNVDTSDRSSNRRLLIRKDSQSSVKTYQHSNSSRRLISSAKNTTTTSSRRRKSVSFPTNQQHLITATHIIPKPSSTEIQQLYYTNDEILHMKKIYQYNVKKKVTKSMREFGNKIKERLIARNVDDDLSVECIVNAGEDIGVSSSSGECYARSSSMNNKMGGVIERASSTLPSMITLLL